MKQAKVYLTVAVQVLDDTGEGDVLDALSGALYGGDLTLVGSGLAVQWVQIDNYEEV
jgi:hypothetical protein